MSLLHQNPPPFPRLFELSPNPDDVRRWPNWSKIPLAWRLLGLFLMCLVPRVWMACLVRSACHDAYYYISVAAACGSRNWAEAFGYLDLNIFPLILLSLNSLGLDWVIGGKAWSVLMASLVVLPLFGWVRRLFSDQVAWSACFLYSLHAEFVEFSIEPVRDPTFWFLFNLCLYATLRAVSEARLRWFLAGGLSLALAVHTRSEGWLLTIPFAMWLIRQLVVNIPRRRSLAFGGLAWLAVAPLVVVIINLTVLRGETEWKLGRLTHFQVGWQWLTEQWNPPPNAEAAGTLLPSGESGSASQVNAKLPGAEPFSVKRYFKELASALEQINLSLLVFGLIYLRRELGNWDRAALFLLSIALAGAVWIFYDHYGVLNGRYFYPIYFALVPYIGTGLLVVANALWNWAQRKEQPWLKPQYTAMGLVLFAVVLGWADAFTTNHQGREHEVEFGEWLGETQGPFQCILTDLESSRPGYHIQNAVPRIMHRWDVMEYQCLERPCDLLLLSLRTTPPESWPSVEASARRMGLEPVTFPPGHYARNHFLAFVRSEAKCRAPIHAGNLQKTLR